MGRHGDRYDLLPGKSRSRLSEVELAPLALRNLPVHGDSVYPDGFHGLPLLDCDRRAESRIFCKLVSVVPGEGFDRFPCIERVIARRHTLDCESAVLICRVGITVVQIYRGLC